MAFVLPDSFDELSKITGLGRPTNTENNSALVRTTKSMEASRPQATGSFMSNVGHTLAGAAGAVGNFATHLVADPAVGMYNVGKGLVHNTVNVSHQISAYERTRAIEKQDMENHKALKAGKMTNAQFKAATEKLSAEYQKVNAESEALMADTYTSKKYVHDIAPAAVLGATLAAPVLRAAIPAVEGAGVAAKAAKVANVALKGAGVENPVVNSVPSAIKTGAKIIGKTAINNMTGEQIGATAVDLKHGNLAGAAGNAALLASPLGIDAVAKFAPKIGAKLATSMYGKEGFFSAVARNGGPDMIAHLDSMTGPAAKRVESLLRQVQDYNLQQFDGDARKAGAYFTEYLKNNGRDLAKMDGKTLEKELQDWVGANKTIHDLHAAGELRFGANGKAVELKDGQRLIAARFDQTIKSRLMKDLAAAKGPEGRAAIIADYERSGADWTKNKNLLESVKGAAASGDDAWQKELKGVTSMRSLFNDSTKAKLPRGYIPAITKNARADFHAAEDTAMLDRGVKANAVLGKVGGALDKMGVGTRSQDGGSAVRFRASLANELKGVDGVPKPSQIMRNLKDFAEKQRGITDERQLSTEAIKDATGVTEKQAGQIKKAYIEAYKKMSAADVGAAGKLENNLYRMPGYGTYRRIQGLMRYELNPAFRAQEHVETELLGQITSGGKTLEAPGVKTIDRIFNGGKGTDKLDNTISILRRENVLDGGGFSSVGANDNSYSQINAKLSKTQQRSLAGFVNTLADKAGMPVEDFIKQIDPKTLDNVRSIVQYPRQGFTSSNFAKTMNLVIFPSRYSTKLAVMLGKSLAAAPATTQIATVKGLHDLGNFLNSDEGIKWQADNSEVLGVIKYFNPAANLNGVYKALRGEHVGIGDFGSIGGLPLGAIAQMLQTTGAVPKGDTPYLNPKTGEVVPDKVPTGLAGGVKMALEDLVGSMYSFPGRTLGTALSKRQVTEGILPFLKPAAAEAKSVTRTDLTSDQTRTAAVLSGKPARGTAVVPKLNAGTRSGVSTARVPATVKAPVKAKYLKAPKAKIYGYRPK